MAKRERKQSGHAGPEDVTGLFLVTAFPLFALYLLTLSPTVPLEDGGEMIRASFTLGVTHPPGYPLYTMTGRLLCLIPIGDVAFRLNLFSAVMVSLACALAGLGSYEILARRPDWRAPVLGGRSAAWWAAALGALVLGLGPAVWWQAVIAEKYGMNLFLNALVLAGITLGLVRGKDPARWILLVGLLYGISSTHHGQTVYFAPAVAVFLLMLLPKIQSRRRGRVLVLFSFMIFLALSVKLLFPPIRAAQDPVHNWIDPSNLARYVFYLTGGPYHYRVFYWDLPSVLGRLKFHAVSFVPEQFSWPGVVLAIAGFAWLVRVRRGLALAGAAACFTGVLYCVNFMLTGAAIRTYYMPIFLVISVWLALGLGLLLRALARAGAGWGRLALLVGVAWVIWLGGGHRFDADRSRHYFAYDYSKALLASVPARCILVTYEDRDLFPLWFQQDILGVKPGVILVVANLKGEGGLPDEPERAAKTEMIFPRHARHLGARLPVVASLRDARPGLPVYFTVVNGMIEDYPLLPRGAAYRLLYGDSSIETGEIVAEWARFKRWRTVRGVFDSSVCKDLSTMVPISYYAYSDYRRGYLLSSRGGCRDAVAFFRSALAWPYFKWLGPVATRAALGGCLLELGDGAGAEVQYIEAIRLAPAWRPALRALGALYFRQGRRLEARGIFRRIIDLDPDDPQARRDLAALESLLPSAAE